MVYVVQMPTLAPHSAGLCISIDISWHEINVMQPNIRGHEVVDHHIPHRAYRISNVCRDNVFHTKRQMIDGNTFVIITLRATGFLPARTLNVPNTRLLWIFSDTLICWGVITPNLDSRSSAIPKFPLHSCSGGFAMTGESPQLITI